MRKIACIRFHDHKCEYVGEFKFLDFITDWAEVDEDTFNVLKNAQFKFNFRLVEQLPSDDFLPQTVEAYIAFIKKEKEKEEKEKEKRKIRKVQSKESKIKALKSKLAQLETE